MKTINVVAAVIMKEGKVFATQRGYGVRQKNRWVNGGSSYAKEDGTLAENEWLETEDFQNH